MLSSKSDAEDVLQDAYLRWHGVDVDTVESSEAWLVTAVTRLSIDYLRKAKVARDAYFGPWLPEPLADSDIRTPEVIAEFDGDLSIAFLTVLETLAPEERAAFILHDIMDDDYADIAEALDKSEAACRQMVHRARERVSSRRRRFVVDDATRIRLLEKFIALATTGDREAMIELFASDATMIADGGGKATAVHRILHGARRIAWLWFAVSRQSNEAPERRIVRINGEPGLALFWGGRLYSLSTIETDGERIHTYYSIVNPDKLKSFT
jgi:RNA polymerase sigma-70 factor (ECF subfamily)